jgi:hypothetical protein
MENNLAIRSEICLHTIKWVKLENGTLRKICLHTIKWVKLENGHHMLCGSFYMKNLE